MKKIVNNIFVNLGIGFMILCIYFSIYNKHLTGNQSYKLLLVWGIFSVMCGLLSYIFYDLAMLKIRLLYASILHLIIMLLLWSVALYYTLIITNLTQRSYLSILLTIRILPYIAIFLIIYIMIWTIYYIIERKKIKTINNKFK